MSTKSEDESEGPDWSHYLQFGLTFLFLALIGGNIFSAVVGTGYPIVVPLMLAGVIGGGLGLVGRLYRGTPTTFQVLKIVGQYLLVFAVACLGSAYTIDSLYEDEYKYYHELPVKVDEEVPPTGGVIPLEVDKDHTTYRFRVNQDIYAGEDSTYQHWSVVTIELLDQNKEYITGVQSELWEEAGVDDGYVWYEDDERFSGSFQIPSSGSYFLRFRGESNVDSTMLAPIEFEMRTKSQGRKVSISSFPLRIPGHYAVFFGMMAFVAGRGRMKEEESDS